MRTLALLSIWLALPLLAQDQKPVASSGTLESKQTPLSTDESGQLALLLMQAQAARISMLEKLMAKQAGGDDLAAADSASQAYTKQLQVYIKDHAACQGGQWNFAERNWACPSK